REVQEPIIDSEGKAIIGNDGMPVMRIRERTRTAVLAIVCCRTAWNQARWAKPDVVPALNPFVGVDLEYEAKPTRPVTHAELLPFVNGADDSGDASIGTPR